MNKDNEPIFTDFDLTIDEPARPSPKPAAAPTVKKAPTASSGLLNLLFVCILVLGAACGYLVLELQKTSKQLAKNARTLQAQTENLSILNERLSVTGENANLSLDALKAIVKEQDSEIRKLWDVSNKRNRGNIEQNTRAITQLTNNAKRQADAQAAQIQKIEQQSQQWHKEQTLELTNQTKEFQQLRQQAQELELRLAQQKENADSKNKQLAQLQKNLAAAQEHIKSLQAEIAVISASNASHDAP